MGPESSGAPYVLWNGFANMATLQDQAVTIVRGEGTTVLRHRGRPYLDAIASLWYCNVGHGRAELADAAAAQMRELAAYQTFEPFANLPAQALASRVADLAPVAGRQGLLHPRRRVGRRGHRGQARAGVLARGRPARQADQHRAGRTPTTG